jgi:N-methylhydantoinase A
MLQIAVDVGGTFTDVVCLVDGKRLGIAKVPTTPSDVVEGILEGARTVLGVVGGEARDVSRFVHSTTIATNAVLEHKGARTALLMTKGFEDVLEIGRQKRSELYNLQLDPQTPSFLSPRRFRAGITERIDVDGAILKPLDENEIVETLSRLIERYDIQSVAVSYLFSFVNSLHERRTREIINESFPHLSVSISSEVDPVFREFERTCVTCFDAYVRPNVADYIEKLSRALSRTGINARLQVMQSRGGITAAAIASEKPVSMLMSGPAAGVIGARHVGALSNFPNLITVDIGGTSCDVALVRDGKQLLSRDGRIGNFPLRMSMIDVQTVGAGGGSIVWRDETGGLRVGPQSAGSVPGPLCYGRGGTEPTVTDASVALGYLNPDYFAGGQIKLDGDASRRGIEKAAERFSMPPETMAAGIHRILNERMANEIRLVSVKRGYDPRQFALVALGGAGPVHGSRLASLLSIPTVIVPSTPGVLAAFGLLVSNIEHEQTRTIGVRSNEADHQAISVLFDELDAACAAKIGHEDANAATINRFVDVRYAGQSFELEVPIPVRLGPDVFTNAAERFHEMHRAMFGYERRDMPTEIINIRAVHVADLGNEPVFSTRQNGAATHTAALKGTRQAYFEDADAYRETPIYDRNLLTAGMPIEGPAIVEQHDTTTVVYPGDVAIVDNAGNLLITVGKGGRA